MKVRQHYEVDRPRNEANYTATGLPSRLIYWTESRVHPASLYTTCTQFLAFDLELYP